MSGANPPNIAEILAKAQQVKGKLAEVQRELAVRRFEGSAGGGMVTVVVTGELRVLEVRVEPGLFAEDLEALAAVAVEPSGIGRDAGIAEGRDEPRAQDLVPGAPVFAGRYPGHQGEVEGRRQHRRQALVAALEAQRVGLPHDLDQRRVEPFDDLRGRRSGRSRGAGAKDRNAEQQGRRKQAGNQRDLHGNGSFLARFSITRQPRSVAPGRSGNACGK